MKISTLKKRADFVNAHQQGQKWVTPVMVVQVFKREEAQEHGHEYVAQDVATLRIGFTASKKTGNAVHRNRTKRRLRAVAREVVPCFDLSGYDLVLIGRGDTKICEFEKLKKNLNWALRKLGIAQAVQATQSEHSAPQQNG